MNRSIRVVYGSASKETRERLVDRIMVAINGLRDQPYKGSYEPWLAHLKMDHRRLVAGKFKVVYRVLKTKVIVVDIFDARQDPKRMMG